MIRWRNGVDAKSGESLFILVQIQAGPPAFAAPQLRLGRPFRSEDCPAVARRAKADRSATLLHRGVGNRLQFHLGCLRPSRHLLIRDLKTGVRVERQTQTVIIDPQVKFIEQEMMKVLGTKVKIEINGTKGKVVLDYYNHEDLDRIFNAIMG